MLKQQARLLAGSVFTLDLALVAAAFLAAYSVRSRTLPWLFGESFPTALYPLGRYLPLLPLALLVWGVTLLATRQYRSHRTTPILQEVLSVIRVTAIAAVSWTLLIFAFRLDVRLLESDRVSRSWILLFALLSGLFLMVEKLALRVTSRYVRHRGFNYRTLLIVGTNRVCW